MSKNVIALNALNFIKLKQNTLIHVPTQKAILLKIMLAIFYGDTLYDENKSLSRP